MYYFKYVLHKENWIPTVMFVTMSASILASMVLPKLEAKFGKRNLFMYTSILCAIPLFIIGFMPTMGMVGLSVLLVVFGFFYGLVSALPWAMVPDCIDFAQWKYGVQPNGLFTATFTFITKM